MPAAEPTTAQSSGDYAKKIKALGRDTYIKEAIRKLATAPTAATATATATSYSCDVYQTAAEKLIDDLAKEAGERLKMAHEEVVKTTENADKATAERKVAADNAEAAKKKLDDAKKAAAATPAEQATTQAAVAKAVAEAKAAATKEFTTARNLAAATAEKAAAIKEHASAEAVEKKLTSTTSPFTQKIRNLGEQLDTELTTLITGTEAEIEEHKKFLDRLTDRKNIFQTQLTNLKNRVTSDPSQKASLEKTIAAESEKLKRLEAQVKDLEEQIDEKAKLVQTAKTANPETDKTHQVALKKSQQELKGTRNRAENKHYQEAKEIIATVNQQPISTAVLTRLKGSVKDTAPEGVYDPLIQDINLLNQKIEALKLLEPRLAHPDITEAEKKEFYDLVDDVVTLNITIAHKLNDGRTLLERHAAATAQAEMEALCEMTSKLKELQTAAHKALPSNYWKSKPLKKNDVMPVLGDNAGSLRMTLDELSDTYSCMESNWVPKDPRNPSGPGNFVRSQVHPPLNPTGEDILAVMAKWNGPEGKEAFLAARKAKTIPENIPYEKISWKNGKIECGHRAIRDLIKVDLKTAQEQREKLQKNPVASVTTSPTAVVPAVANGTAVTAGGTAQPQQQQPQQQPPIAPST
ncbi:MAG: hypothetical protein COY58_02620 [Gammaproteobacteria bacterium CG_4_10_14_0_8_um_filter_38_16]|nr:MAG: hypothetical protein COY58_02620 [Gammaproteobacteria bacterium CG_4_10_14_0_8_um_filter_38_16]PJA03827.1 MAG: hypothetical protein COX72_02780 [Gammaproteobacteria bacterium CG_4_10_14_0_2_um_filter_38_22]PJB10801.1 MAG: hypothetical protein CO120_02885 [Gammaproteobacteria bacterium CG_4_9_14_3_um_filter_38_9]